MLRSYLSYALILAGCASLLTSCAGSSTTAPATPAIADPLGAAWVDATGNTTSALGAWTLQVDALTMEATVAPVRTAEATSFGQGDVYNLSIRPFFRPKDLKVSGLQLDPDGQLRVTVRVSHPFARPNNLGRPATSTHRIDLHLFETDLVLAAEGADTFFNGSVKMNHGLVSNADGYRKTGPLFDPAGFGITNANTFPYVMLGDFDTLNPRGNYDPLDNGWREESELMNPTGYGVFPQGASRERDLVLDLGIATSVTLGLVVVAKYQDPRAGDTAALKRANRMPEPNIPSLLRYILPQGAGDLERMSIDIASSVPDDNASVLANVSGTILDWDATATVVSSANWPMSDLSEIPENSMPQNAQADVPSLQASGPFNLTLTPTPGEVEVALSGVIRNTDLFPVTGAPVQVKGLLRVSDTQDSDDASPTGVLQQVLNESSTAPLPNPETTLLPTIRYQAFSVTVTDGGGGANADSPTCGSPAFGPSYSPGPNTISATTGATVTVDLDAGLPTDSDGLSLYEIDWDYVAATFTIDDSVLTTSGDSAPEFSRVEPIIANRVIALRYTDNYIVPGERNSTICTVNLQVTASPASFTFQPQEVAINADPAQNFKDTRTYTYEYKRIQSADPQGDMYYFYRWNAAPNSWFISRTVNGGDSWGAPSQIPTPFLGTLTTGTSFNLAMTILPTLSVSHPVIVGTSGATSSTQTLAMLRGADSGTNATTWGTTTGNTMGPVSDYRGTIVTGDLTDLSGNRAYLLARDTNSGSPNHNRLVLFRCTNAQAAIPTWTQIATPDANGGGGLNGEANSVMVIDLAGNLHIAYITGPIGSNDVRYVKVNSPATVPSIGLEVNISNSGTDNVGELQIFVDTTHHALVAYERWMSNDSSQGRIFAARGDVTGTAFGAPVQIDTSGADCQMPDIVVEPSGAGYVIVAYARKNVADEIYVTARSADLLTQIVPPTRAHTDIPSSDLRYPHVNIDVVRLRTMVCYERSGFGGPLSVPDSNYELRSRWFQVTP